MRIAIFLFDGVTALDPIGVYDPLARLPDTDITFVSETGDPCRTGDGFLSLAPSAAIGDVESVDMLLIPGGSTDGLRQCMGSEGLRSSIARLDQTTIITASVCTGSLILGASGLLRGRKATTNWRAKEYLARFGAEYTGERVTKAEKYWTSAGVTAGIDLVSRYAATSRAMSWPLRLNWRWNMIQSHHSAPAIHTTRLPIARRS